MYFDHQYLERIKSSANLLNLIGSFVKLKKAGSNYVGLCPFHSEKTPSFNVNPRRGSYYCFGCSKGGNAINFIMDIKKYPFFESVKYLAGLYNIPLPEMKKKSKESVDSIDIQFKINDEARIFFVENLQKKMAIEARKYLDLRKIPQDAIKKFQIGFSFDKKSDLFDYLRSKNYKDDDIVRSGLAIRTDNGVVIDRFRNRIMFPIINNYGKTIGFGGRSLGDEMPKYLNSSESDIFKKSYNLYSENIAKSSAYMKEEVILVEGYMDVVALNIVGVSNVVAALGTAVSEYHLNQLWKYSKEPIILMDGDKAGFASMKKIANIALPILKDGNSLKFVQLPLGNDPDDYIKTYGVHNFLDIIKNNYIPLSEFLWQILYQKDIYNTPEQKSSLEKIINDLLEKITNPIIKKNYRVFFNEKIWHNLKKIKNDNGAKSFNLQRNISLEDGMDFRICKNLIAEILLNPTILSDEGIYEEFFRLDFKEDLYNEFRSEIINGFEINKESDNLALELKNYLQNNGFSDLYENLCGKDSSLVDKISSSGILDNKSNWEILYKKYHLAILQKEFKMLIENMEEDSFLKAKIFIEQIYELESKIRELELEFNNDD